MNSLQLEPKIPFSKGVPPKGKLLKSRKPMGMTLEEWQIALRRESAGEQKFTLKNLRPKEPVFSDFSVTNRGTKKKYRVLIRSQHLGENYCDCPDFIINTLGTCKHIEYALARLKQRPGYGRMLVQGYQARGSEIILRYGAKRDVVFRPGSVGSPFLTRLASKYFDAQGILKPEAYFQFETFLKRAKENGETLRCLEDVLAFIAQVRDQKTLKEKVSHIFSKETPNSFFKERLKVPLYPYQKEGALFAARAGRSLIADDMGLGKTIQAIAAAEILSMVAGVERVLVVCPTSLKHQWKQEISKFAARTVEVVEGSLTSRIQKYKTGSFYKITNYDTIHRDLDRIGKWRPDLIILDEAQRIKNWKTRTAQNVKKLQSEYAIVLTGTPLENRLEELHSIVEFVDRFHLGPAFRFLHDHQTLDDHGKVVGYRALSKIKETLKPILIRRTKQEVLKQLPERLEKNFFVPMTEEQWSYHDENRETAARIVAKWRKVGFLTEKDQHILMCALQNMRMVCDSTYLLNEESHWGPKVDEFGSLVSDLLEEPARKVVVFSQWLKMHALLADRLKSKRIGHILFHGGVPSKERGKLIQQFKEDSDTRIFLSTDAGGLGLNLQNATAVLNMDLPWNPAVLEQRIGRVHRLGQRQPVQVFNFISQGTIEHSMLDLLAFKKSLFSGVLDDGQDEIFMGGSRLKRFMESVEKVTASIPTVMPAGLNGGEDKTKGVQGFAQKENRQEGPAREQKLFSEALMAGASFLEKLGKAYAKGNGLQDNGNASMQKGEGSLPKICQDDHTGESYLKLPLPKPAAIEKAMEWLGAFTRSL